MTECSETLFPFEAHFSRQVVAQFEGSWPSTEGDSLLLRQADRKIRPLRRVARCFTDYRQPERIEHRLRRDAGATDRWAMRIWTIRSNCGKIRCQGYWPESAISLNRWPAKAR